MNQLLKLENITKNYNFNFIFNQLNLEINRNSIVALLGENGSGKTTLLKIISGLTFIKSGEITYYFDDDYPSLKENICYIPDGPFIYKNVNMKQLASLLKSSYNQFNLSKFNKLIKEFEVPTMTKYSALSKGNKAKVNLIIALSRESLIKCLDEPLDGIDASSRNKFIEFIKEDSLQNCTYLISTHNLNKFKDIFTDKFYIFEQKLFIYDDTVKELFDDEK